MKKKVAAVVLAAGESKRMGENKLLMPFDGMPIFEHILKTLTKLKIDTVVVTCYDEIRKVASDYNIKVVENYESYLGQSRSVMLGTQSIINYDAVIFIPADQPLISTKTISEVINVFNKTDKIVVSKYNNQRCMPNLFPKRYFNDLLNIKGDIGGRDIINKNKDDVENYGISNTKEGFDIDCKEDYIRLKNNIL